MVKIKRVYDAPAKGDGRRVLVDRLWPRGLTRRAAAIDEWMKDLGPSHALRKWFGHDARRWPEFRRRYQHELDEQQAAVLALARRAERGPLTLLYATRDTAHNNAVALRSILTRLHRRRRRPIA
jgi:uncharacterized protein YeaO (DUF488 family)